MRDKSGLARSDSLKMLAIALLALLVGAALSPTVVSAAASLQGVLVKNSSASAVYVQPPGHTVERLHVSGVALNGSGAAGSLFAVPAGKWLVIKEASFQGAGDAPAQLFDVHADDGGTLVAFPASEVASSGAEYVQSSSLSGDWVFAPGTNVRYLLTHFGSGSYSYKYVLNGYLTQKP